MTDLKKYTLLIVDDDAELRDIICSIFETYGFTVLSANSGTSAFEVVKKQKINLIVSDIRMADGDGMTLLKKVRERNPEFPIVIFITGFTDIPTEECIKHGAKNVITKPFDRQHLVDTVKSSLGIA
ncbi:MAG: response regulator [Bdellovibrionota bacterium]